MIAKILDSSVTIFIGMNKFLRKLSEYFKSTTWYYSMRLLPRKDYKFIMFVILLQVGLGALDLVGVLVIGLVGSLSISGIASGKPGNRTLQALDFFGIQDLTFQKQVATLGLVAATFLVFKTLSSMFLNRRIIYFLSNRSARISEELIMKFFALPLLKLNNVSQQEAINSLTSGIKVLLVGVLSVWITLISDISLLIVMGAGLFAIDSSAAIGALLLFGGIAVILHILLQAQVRKNGQIQSMLEIGSSEGISNAILGSRELTVHNRRFFFASAIVSKRYLLASTGASLSFLLSISKYLLELALVLPVLNKFCISSCGNCGYFYCCQH
jgi:hypothetical protein